MSEQDHPFAERPRSALLTAPEGAVMTEYDKKIYNMIGSSSRSFESMAVYGEVVKKGFLEKQGDRTRYWSSGFRVRECVVQGNFLFYFVPSPSYRELHPRGCIYLRGADISKPAKPKHCIEIMPRVARHPGWDDDKSKSFLLKLGNDHERDEWFDVLRGVSLAAS